MWQNHPLAQSISKPQLGSLIGLHRKRSIFPAVVTRSFSGGTISVTYTDFDGRIYSYSAPPSQLRVIDYPEINIGEEYWSDYSHKYVKIVSVHYNTQLNLWYCRIPYEDGTGSINSSCVSIPMRNLMNNLRRNRENKQEPKMTLYIAVRDTRNLMVLTEALKRHNREEINIMSDDSYTSLQNRLRSRIVENPTEVWTIFSGTTVAEIDRPPVRFRGL